MTDLWGHEIVNWQEARERRRFLPRAKAAFLVYVKILRYPPEAAYAKREAEIEALPKAVWKGRNLRTLRCNECGRERNVPASMLWVIVSVTNFTCEWCVQKTF